MNNLTLGWIDSGNEVKVLTMETAKHPMNLNALSLNYKNLTKMEAVFIDTSVKTSKAFLNLFLSGSYNVERFFSKTFERKLTQILLENSFDIIQLESLYLTPYLKIIRKHSRAKVILRSHNVEYRLWERLAIETKGLLRKKYFYFLSGRLKKYEIKHLNSYDAIAVISPQDGDLFRQMGSTSPIIHVPFGMDYKRFSFSPENNEPDRFSLFHLGSMDWLPNQEAVNWFLKKVWGSLHENHPDLKLYLAGKNMPSRILNLKSKNIFVSNEILQPMEFMQSKSIMIVPLFSGGGMRIKIIEGMAMGKVIVSTSIGAEGIVYEDQKNILIANTPLEFINAINKCLSDKTFCESVGNNARQLVEEKYNNEKISASLAKFCENLLSKIETGIAG